MPTAKSPPCFLFDNGSLRADSIRSLRQVAAMLANHLAFPVFPVSLLHSSAVDPQDLDGQPAVLLEPALDAHLSAGGREAVVLPLFFGPSAALTDYVPARLASLRLKHPGADLRLAEPLVRVGDLTDTRIAQALAGEVRSVRDRRNLGPVQVLLVDHGTPQRAVTAVREQLGAQLRAELAEEANAVGTASMERREGAAYAFNEPLLERALRKSPFDRGDVIVALQFLAPGRHAGAGGDVAGICAAAEAEQPGLRTHLTSTLGAHPALISVLAERYRAVAGR